MKPDLVYIVHICKGCRQMHAGLHLRHVAKFALAQHGPERVKITEVDPQLKKEFSEIFD